MTSASARTRRNTARSPDHRTPLTGRRSAVAPSTLAIMLTITHGRPARRWRGGRGTSPPADQESARRQVRVAAGARSTMLPRRHDRFGPGCPTCGPPAAGPRPNRPSQANTRPQLTGKSTGCAPYDPQARLRKVGPVATVASGGWMNGRVPGGGPGGSDGGRRALEPTHRRRGVRRGRRSRWADAGHVDGPAPPRTGGNGPTESQALTPL